MEGGGDDTRTGKKGVPKASLSHFTIKYYITIFIRAPFIFATPHNKNSCVSTLTIQFKPQTLIGKETRSVQKNQIYLKLCPGDSHSTEC